MNKYDITIKDIVNIEMVITERKMGVIRCQSINAMLPKIYMLRVDDISVPVRKIPVAMVLDNLANFISDDKEFALWRCIVETGVHWYMSGNNYSEEAISKISNYCFFDVE